MNGKQIIGRDMRTGEYVSEEQMEANRDRYERIAVYTDERLNTLWRLVYEPEHTKTMCWCKPLFIKKEGKLHIVHNEQKDTITDYVAQLSHSQSELN